MNPNLDLKALAEVFNFIVVRVEHKGSTYYGRLMPTNHIRSRGPSHVTLQLVKHFSERFTYNDQNPPAVSQDIFKELVPDIERNLTVLLKLNVPPEKLPAMHLRRKIKFTDRR